MIQESNNDIMSEKDAKEHVELVEQIQDDHSSNQEFFSMNEDSNEEQSDCKMQNLNEDRHEYSNTDSNFIMASSVILEQIDATKKENSDLHRELDTLKSLMEIVLDENDTMKSRLLNFSRTKDEEINRLQLLCQHHQIDVSMENEPHLLSSTVHNISMDQSQLFESKSRLELDTVHMSKEIQLLKKKNLKLGELLVQRDAILVKQRNEIIQFSESLNEVNQIKIEKEELQRSVIMLRESSLHHTNELQQSRSSHLAVKQELLRCRQERNSIEKEYHRTECALRKSNDTIVSIQLQVTEAVDQQNTLAITVDDMKREIHLLESQNISINDKQRKLEVEYEAERLQHLHWEGLMRSEVERYQLLLEEYDQMKIFYQDLYIRFTELKADNYRLQRQCSQLAGDAETARASVLTYKGHMRKSEKSFEELLRENVYLCSVLKQKEGQMEEAEEQWKHQLVEAVKEATLEQDENNDEELNPSLTHKVTNPKLNSTVSPLYQHGSFFTRHNIPSNEKIGYSFPLPSNHPFVTSSLSHQSTPKRTTAPMEPKPSLSPSFSTSGTKSTSSNETLPTQPLSSYSQSRVSENSMISFDSVINDVLRQADELRLVADYYERQD